VENHPVPCVHNNLIEIFPEILTDSEHMQLSLNDIPVHLQKCGIPMILKIILSF
jgi:hypothetical protein